MPVENKPEQSTQQQINNAQINKPADPPPIEENKALKKISKDNVVALLPNDSPDDPNGAFETLTIDESLDFEAGDRDEMEKPDTSRPVGMVDSYWKTGGFGAAAGTVGVGGMAAVGATIGVTAVVGLGGFVGAGLAALGGCCMMFYAGVKRRIQAGRQNFRNDYLNKNWTSFSEQEKNCLSPSKISRDQWNDVLDFRVRRMGGFRRGFTDRQRQLLSQVVVDYLRRGGSVNRAKDFVQRMNQLVRQRGFSQEIFLTKLDKDEFYIASQYGLDIKGKCKEKISETLLKDLEKSSNVNDIGARLTWAPGGDKKQTELNGCIVGLSNAVGSILGKINSGGGRLEFGLNLAEDLPVGNWQKPSGNSIIDDIGDARKNLKDLMSNVDAESEAYLAFIREVLDDLEVEVEEMRSEAINNAKKQWGMDDILYDDSLVKNAKSLHQGPSIQPNPHELALISEIEDTISAMRVLPGPSNEVNKIFEKIKSSMDDFIDMLRKGNGSHKTIMAASKKIEDQLSALDELGLSKLDLDYGAAYFKCNRLVKYIDDSYAG